MPAPTVAVTVRLSDFGGGAEAGVVITARLSAVDYTPDGTFVSTEPVTATTDEDGIAVLNLFPNALVPSGLGTRGTVARVTAPLPNSRYLSVQAAIPNEDCSLTSCLVDQEFNGLDASQLAASDAQAARDLAQQWATQTDEEVEAGQGYGAKKYAEDAAASEDSASDDAIAAAASAVAAAASEALAQQHADDALDYASEVGDAVADAELARDETLNAVGNIFDSVTNGLAAAGSGEHFVVAQTYGEGVDCYLDSAGTAVWQRARASGDLAIAQVIERNYPFPVAPVACMFSHHTLVQDGRGANNAARPADKIFARNLYAYVHSPRQAGSGPTVTTFYADGPTATGTATRVLYTAAAQLFSIWTSAYRPPAGTYTVRFKCKSNTAGDFAIRFGNSAAGYSAGTALAAGWTTFTLQFTTNGTDYATFVITGDGANTPDLLVDEMQIYNAASTDVPAFSTELPGDDFMPALAWPKARHVLRALDNRTSAVEGSGILRVQGYPAALAFTAITMIVIATIDESSTNHQFLTTDASTPLGTTNSTLAISSNQSDAAPDCTGITMFAANYMLNQGFETIGFAVGPTDRVAYLDNIEIGSAVSAFAGFSARMFRVGANANTETAYQNSFRLRGRIAAAAVFNQKLSATQYAATVAAMKARVRAAGIRVEDHLAFMVALGDSQTSSFSGTRGPSWAVLQAVDGTHTPNLAMRNLAAGGATLADVVTNQLPVALRVIAQTIAVEGRICVVPLFVSTNDQSTIIADHAAWWETLQTTLLEPIVAAGGIPIIGTPCPDGSADAGWEAARLSLRTLMLASDYAVADMGDPATTMGDPATTLGGVYYDSDFRHFLAAGHALLAVIWAAAIAAAIAAA